MGWDCCCPGPAHTQSNGAGLVSSCVVTATAVPYHPFLQEPEGNSCGFKMERPGRGCALQGEVVLEEGRLGDTKPGPSMESFRV